jgi:hypothetical protein
MRRRLRCALVFAVLMLLGQQPFSVEAAPKNTPQRFSSSEFKALVDQSLGGSSQALGAARDVTSGSIVGVNGALFYRFANATVGWVPGASMMQMVDKTEEDGYKCSQSNYSKDVPGIGARRIILAAASWTCVKEGRDNFLGFVLFVNESANAGHLFWVTGTGAGIPAAAGQRVLDALFERLRRDYID